VASYEERPRASEAYEAPAEGSGWVAFAGVMILIAGFLSVIWGIAAIDGSRFFTDEGRYVIITNLNAWGWFYLIVGILQLIAAFSIWNRHIYGRIIGVFTAAVSAILILFTVNAFPFAAFMLFIIDLLVIYGLVAYGGQPRRAA
jgi:uncharacterized membrane protein HdeD (DUF308 family)